MNEDRLQRIENALGKILSNELPHLKTGMATLDERTKGHGKLLAAVLTMVLAILVAVLVK